MNREPFSLQDAWQNVGSLYATIVALFGAPFEIATQLLLMRENRRDILCWLGPVEALARRPNRDQARSNCLPFRPYRPRATCARSALDDAQHEIDLAFNTS